MKHLLLIFMLIVSSEVSAQHDIVFEFKKLQYKKDVLEPDSVRTFSFTANSLSPYIELGSVNGKTFAIRVEVIPSNIEKQGDYISVMCFYLKENNVWKQIHRAMYERTILKELKEKQDGSYRSLPGYLNGFMSGEAPDYEFECIGTFHFFRDQ